MALVTSNLMLSLKFLLISVGAVCSAMIVKASFPLVLYDLPLIWTTLMAWLKPPYLYVVINGIIVIIVATSWSGHHKESADQSQPLITARTPPPSDLISISQTSIYSQVNFQSEQKVFEVKPVPVNEPEVLAVNHDDELAENDSVVTSRSVLTPVPETELLQQLAKEKPLVSSRFGHRRLPTRMSPEGVKSLRVARAKRQETLESTWKKITEGRHVPLTRHLKKSDTWQNHGRHQVLRTVESPEENDINLEPPQQNHHHQSQRHVIKSETFNDSPKANTSRTPAKLRKEPSLSQDELNRRVEAFINKFNEEMRLQRQHSLQQYLEMINRGV